MIQSHHLPTCDDVFDVLTRGPFPTGEQATDFPVERHLTVCHSCRELAEALRPATELLAEQQSDDGIGSSLEESGWPVYLAAEANGDRRFLPDQVERPRTAVENGMPGSQGSWVLLALSIAVLASLGVQALGVDSQRGGDRAADGVIPPVQRLGTHAEGEVWPVPEVRPLACSLAAVEAAQETAGGNGALLVSLVAENFSAAECCSQCHHPRENEAKVARASLQSTQMLALVSRCAICHVPR